MPDATLPDAKGFQQEQPYKPKAIWTRVDYPDGLPPALSSHELTPGTFWAASVKPLPESMRQPLPEDFKKEFIRGSVSILSLNPEDSVRNLPSLDALLREQLQRFDFDEGENQILNTLVGGIRHDIGKQIADAIQGSSGFLSMPDISEELQQSFKKLIFNGIAHAKAAINSWGPMLEYIEAGKIHFNEAGETMRRFLEIAAGGSKIPAENLSRINLPSGPLEVILGNLVTNTKAKGGKTASLFWSSGVEQLNGNTELVIRAWDEVGGYSEKIIDQETTLPKFGETDREGGSGKGLRLIDTIADLLSGSVETGNWFKSGQKRGVYSTFRVPIHEVKTDTKKPPM